MPAPDAAQFATLKALTATGSQLSRATRKLLDIVRVLEPSPHHGELVSAIRSEIGVLEEAVRVLEGGDHTQSGDEGSRFERLEVE